MLKKYSLDEYVQMLNISNPNENEFNNIVNEFSYFKTNTGTGKLSNYNFERGLLVYLLVGKLKPKNILEVGPASGHNSLYIAACNPDKFDLLEPNPIAVNEIRELYKQVSKSYFLDLQ